MKKVIALCSALMCFICLASVSFAYKAIPFRNGGSIEGTVEFTDPQVPQDPMLTVTTDTEYCGKSKPAEKYLIKERKVQNVVVFLSGISAGKPVPREGVLLTSKKCEITPHVAVGFSGSTLSVKNGDPILDTFDVHDMLTGREIFHVTLSKREDMLTKELKSAGLLSVSCYVHPWEKAYLYVFDQPYAAVTDENGKFVINDIPPGIYTIEAWHEALGTEKISDIKVESGKASMVTLKFGK